MTAVAHESQKAAKAEKTQKAPKARKEPKVRTTPEPEAAAPAAPQAVPVAAATSPAAPRTPLRDRLRITQRVTRARELLARAVSVVTGLCALVLVAGALLIALGGNDANPLVEWVKATAAQVDFGVFERRNGVFTFAGKDAATKSAVVNWGLAAVVWLVLGRVVSGVVRK